MVVNDRVDDSVCEGKEESPRLLRFPETRNGRWEVERTNWLGIPLALRQHSRNVDSNRGFITRIIDHEWIQPQLKELRNEGGRQDFGNMPFVT